MGMHPEATVVEPWKCGLDGEGKPVQAANRPPERVPSDTKNQILEHTPECFLAPPHGVAMWRSGNYLEAACHHHGLLEDKSQGVPRPMPDGAKSAAAAARTTRCDWDRGWGSLVKAGLLSHSTEGDEPVKVCGPRLHAVVVDVGSSAVRDIQGSLKLVHLFEMGNIAQGGMHSGQPLNPPQPTSREVSPGSSLHWLARPDNQQ